ncbi:MAG: hypothetical protein SF162_16325 [bacterium]|nr:hypothetical protein [bacterium]
MHETPTHPIPSLNVRQWGWIAITLIVALIGIGLFATAGTAFSEDGQIARRWIDAWCAGDWETMYDLSLVGDSLTREAFIGRVEAYMRDAGLELPCVGVLDLNLLRAIPVPLELADRVDSIRIFETAQLIQPDQRRYPLTVWAYRRTGSSEWRIYPDFLAPTIEQPSEPGAAAELIDSSGVLIGFVTVLDAAQVYTAADQVVIGVPLRIQTLMRPWEFYGSALLIGSERGFPVENVNQVPPALRRDFIGARGDYVAQNLHLNGMTWYRFEGRSTVDQPLTLTFWAHSVRTETSLSAYLNVATGAVAPLAWYPNPVTAMEQVGVRDPDLIFLASLTNPTDTTAVFQCASFVAVLQDGRWDAPEYCTFSPEPFRAAFAPGESARIEVRYNGLQPGDVAQILYRVSDEARLSSYIVWPAQSDSELP